MPATPFFVCATRKQGDCSARTLIYVAYAATPDQAVEAVRPLVGESTDLRATGETLSPIAARAIGLRPGQARLV